MAKNTRKSENERESAVSDENEASSNVTSTAKDQRGDEVVQGVGDFCKQKPEGTEATPLAVTSKMLHE